MRLFLDRLYQTALYLSALCLLIIGVLVGIQLAGRILDGLLQLSVSKYSAGKSCRWRKSPAICSPPPASWHSRRL